MKKWIIGTLIGFGALALGVGGAFAYDAVNPVDSTAQRPDLNSGYAAQRGWDRPGMGMRFAGQGDESNTAAGQSISVEEAQTIAAQYLADENLGAELTGNSVTTRHGYAFEYSIDGVVIGSVHVNTFTGQARICPMGADLDSD
jgi:hypothetical protein